MPASLFLPSVWPWLWPPIPHSPAYLPAILSVSFLAGILVHFPEVSWTGWPLNRPGFGMPVNAFALYSAVVLCGLLLFGRNVLPGRRQRHPLWRGVLLAAALLAAFSGVVLPQSRSAWLACLLVFPWLWFLRKRQGSFRFPGKPAWVFLLLVLILAGAYGQSMIERTKQDRAMLRTVLQDGLQDFRPANMTSAGTRVILWQEGVRRWLEKPLTGWGPRRTTYLTEPLWSSFHIDKARDFHNSYLELLVRTGVFGIVLFAVLVYIALRSLYAGFRARWFTLDLALFVLGALLLFAICSFFNDRLDHMGRNFLSLFIGAACSYRYRTALADPPKNHSNENPSWATGGRI